MAVHPSAALGTQVRQTSVILFHQCTISKTHIIGFEPTHLDQTYPVFLQLSVFWRRVRVSIPHAVADSCFQDKRNCQFCQLSKTGGRSCAIRTRDLLIPNQAY